MKEKEWAEKLREVLGEEWPKAKGFAHSSTQIRVPNVAPKHKQGVKKELIAKQVAGDWTAESRQVDRVEVPEGRGEREALAPKRVQRLQLNKLQKLAELASEGQGLAKKVSKQGQVESQTRKDEDLWQDLLKAKEERQFQITRITNFFS